MLSLSWEHHSTVFLNYGSFTDDPQDFSRWISAFRFAPLHRIPTARSTSNSFTPHRRQEIVQTCIEQNYHFSKLFSQGKSWRDERNGKLNRRRSLKLERQLPIIGALKINQLRITVCCLSDCCSLTHANEKNPDEHLNLSAGKKARRPRKNIFRQILPTRFATPEGIQRQNQGEKRNRRKRRFSRGTMKSWSKESLTKGRGKKEGMPEKLNEEGRMNQKCTSRFHMTDKFKRLAIGSEFLRLQS